MGAGGKREGAGRKVGSPNKNTLEIKEILDECVDFREVVKKLFELSQGVAVEETNYEGNKVVYEKQPDTQASKVLLEYRFGKPKQQLDVNVDTLEPTTINVISSKHKD